MIYALSVLLAGLCVVIIGLFYMIIRTEWVYSRRMELIDVFFYDEDFRSFCENKFGSRDFEKCFGSLDDWLYKYPACWNAAKIAKLDKWVK